MRKFTKIALTAALALSLAACSNSNSQSSSEATLTKIKVGASPAPHAEILQQCVEPLKEKGYDLEIVEFTDYVMPNTAVEDGELDANYFAHQPYQDSFNADNGTHIATVAAVHFEPLSIYGGKTASLDDIKDGAVIAVPNDTTNEARALLLCEKLGFIKLPENADLTVTPKDIVENPYNIEFFEVEAAQTVNVLPDCDFAVINGNYAVSAGIADTRLASEDSDGIAATTYANILCVKEGNENNPGIQALAEVLQSDAIKTFITDTYRGAVVPVDFSK